MRSDKTAELFEIVRLLYPVIGVHVLTENPHFLAAVSFRIGDEDEYVLCHNNLDAVDFVNDHLQPDVRVITREGWRLTIDALGWQIFYDRWMKYNLGEDRFAEIMDYLLKEDESEKQE